MSVDFLQIISLRDVCCKLCDSDKNKDYLAPKTKREETSKPLLLAMRSLPFAISAN